MKGYYLPWPTVSPYRMKVTYIFDRSNPSWHWWRCDLISPSPCRALVPVHTPAVSPYRVLLGMNPHYTLNNYYFYFERYVRQMHKISKDAHYCDIRSVKWGLFVAIEHYSNMIAWASR